MQNKAITQPAGSWGLSELGNNIVCNVTFSYGLVYFSTGDRGGGQ